MKSLSIQGNPNGMIQGYHVSSPNMLVKVTELIFSDYLS